MQNNIKILLHYHFFILSRNTLKNKNKIINKINLYTILYNVI